MGEDVSRIGVISDTHGRLHPGVTAAFAGVDLIVHAGDVGSERVLFELQTIAPVIAVEGNMDGFFPAWPLAQTARSTVGRFRIYVTHQFNPQGGSPPPEVDVVIAGHTHRPDVRRLGPVLFVNPGSASHSRAEESGPTVAVLSLTDEAASAEILQLD